MSELKDEGIQLLGLYRQMYLIRNAEKMLSQMFSNGEIPGFIHLSVGQEAVAAGVGAVLDPEDSIAATHRGHGHALAKGIPLDRFFLELAGKADGICKGRGGSMHVADMSVGMLGANGIVGAGLPLALGSAMAHQYKNNGQVAVANFGDGAMAEGVLHESLNLAVLWQLPILFLCENNGWSEFSPTSSQFNAPILELGKAFEIPGQTVDGNDVQAVYSAADSLVEEIKQGKGPRILECMTTRIHGHFEGDPQKYRDQDELDSLSEKDALERAKNRLQTLGISIEAIEKVEQQVDGDIEEAVAIARAGSLADFESTKADVYTNLEVA